MSKEHWDLYEDYPEYEKLDEMPKRVVIKKPDDVGKKKKESEVKNEQDD